MKQPKKAKSIKELAEESRLNNLRPARKRRLVNDAAHIAYRQRMDSFLPYLKELKETLTRPPH